MKEEVVIIGGGVAGLCAAIRLTELGIAPLVIESGTYPSHKVCGEFIGPGSLPFLNSWGIFPIEIEKVQFHTGNKGLSFHFPSPAGSLSHLALDPHLVKKAREGGAKIRTSTLVIDWIPKKMGHTVTLSDGESLEASQVIVATGRMQMPQGALSPKVTPSPFKMAARFVGIKAHFKGFSLEKTLEIFSFDGGYLGISPIENGKYNLACLTKINCFKKYNSTMSFMQHLLPKNKAYQSYMSHGESVFSDWMTVSIPFFGPKKNPLIPNTYWIGDAAGTIPPVSGQGLSLAIQSGIMAANFAHVKDPEGYQKAWNKEFNQPIFWSKIVHQLAVWPNTAKRLISLGHCYPIIPKIIFNKITRCVSFPNGKMHM